MTSPVMVMPTVTEIEPTATVTIHQIVSCSPTEWEAKVSYVDGIAYVRRGQLFELLSWVAKATQAHHHN